jgi:hypothetical protein
MRSTMESARNALAVLASCAALVAGCGALPTSPIDNDMRAPSGTENAAATTMPADDQPSDTPGADPRRATDLSDVLATAPGAGAMSVRESDLMPNGKADVRNGRWEIKVPRGAIDGPARLSVRVPGPASPACELGITPASKNHFAQPVLLVADCRGVSTTQLLTYVISWYDPGTGLWVPVAGSHVDLKKKTVTAPLLHFSVYSVGPEDGKSGW